MSKERILSAAEKLLRRGEDLHIRPLAREAHVSTGTIYNTFATLDELILDLAALFWHRAADALEGYCDEGYGREPIRAAMFEWASNKENLNFLHGLNRHPAMQRVFPHHSKPAQALARVQHAIFRCLLEHHPTIEEDVAARLSVTYTLLFRFLQSGLCDQMPLVEEESRRMPFIVAAFDDLLGFVNTGIEQTYLLGK